MKKYQYVNKQFVIKIILIICAIAMNVKYIFLDYGIDAAFQTVMSYRLVTGDIMFKQMWEPYQMSAFLCAIFIKIFLLIFKSTTGIIIYLQTVGVTIDALISICLYQTIKKVSKNEMIAFSSAWFLFMVSPKDVPIPEYTNMLVWFSVIACILLIKYFMQEKNIYLILTGIAMCGVVLSYPSAVIVYVAVMIFLLCKKKYKAAGIITLVCTFIGIGYLIFVFTVCPPKEFVINIHNMLSLETSHNETIIGKLGRYLIEILKITIFNVVAYACALGISFLISKIKKSKNIFLQADILYFLIVMSVCLYMAIDWRKYVRFNFFLYFIPLIIIGIRNSQRLVQEEMNLYVLGLIIGVADFTSGLLLTNLRLTDTIPLLIPAIIVSFIPIGKELGTISETTIKKNLIYALCIISASLLFIRCGYVIRPKHGYLNSILNIAGITKYGPEIGIISEYMGPHIQNETYPEWQEYVNEGDAIFIIGDSLDTIGYLYKEVEISAPSTVPTPDYNESILEYWEQNPEKYPDVIIASCSDGKLNPMLTEDSFIMRWITEEYKPSNIIESKYWRYYIK